MGNWTQADLDKKGLKVIGGSLSKAPAAQPAPRKHKFNARKTEVDGHVFDSLAEAERYRSLKLMEQARVIRGLGLQPVYALRGANGRAIASFKADFCYFENGRSIVEDVKGVATPLFRLKRKLFLEQYPDHELRVTDKHGNLKTIRSRYPRSAA